MLEEKTPVSCKMDEEGQESIQLPSQVLASVSLRHCGEMCLTEQKSVNTDHHQTAEREFKNVFKMEPHRMYLILFNVLLSI